MSKSTLVQQLKDKIDATQQLINWLTDLTTIIQPWYDYVDVYTDTPAIEHPIMQRIYVLNAFIANVLETIDPLLAIPYIYVTYYRHSIQETSSPNNLHKAQPIRISFSGENVLYKSQLYPNELVTAKTTRAAEAAVEAVQKLVLPYRELHDANVIDHLLHHVQSWDIISNSDNILIGHTAKRNRVLANGIGWSIRALVNMFWFGRRLYEYIPSDPKDDIIEAIHSLHTCSNTGVLSVVFKSSKCATKMLNILRKYTANRPYSFYEYFVDLPNTRMTGVKTCGVYQHA